MTEPDLSPRHRAMIVEALIALAFIAVVGALAIPKVGSAPRTMDAAARALRTTLLMARRTALARPSPVLVSFDTAGQRVRVLEDRDGDAAPDAGERSSWHTLEGGARFTAPAAGARGTAVAAVHGATIRSADGWPSARFARDGSVSSSIEIYLAGSGVARGERRAVIVDAATARATWLRLAPTERWERTER
jgi:Tfp pilus assembly protein FimT